MRMTLGRKIVLGSLGLVVLCVVVLGGFALWRLRGLGQSAVAVSSAAMESQMRTTLMDGARMQREIASDLVRSVQADALRLASSANVAGYVSVLAGTNELWSRQTEQQAASDSASGTRNRVGATSWPMATCRSGTGSSASTATGTNWGASRPR